MHTLKTTLLKTLPFLGLLLPAVTHAQYFGVIDTFLQGVGAFIGAYLVPLVFAISLVVFIWGMFLYFIAGGADEKKREQGKGLALWAVIGLVIMVTIWGIVNLLAGGLLTGLNESNKQLDILPRTPTQ